MKRKLMGQKKQLFTKRFYPAGNYNWVVPPGCTEVDVFLVGGGGSSIATGSGTHPGGGGGGYTKTFKKDTTGWRDGNAISVTPGQSIPIVVGAGGMGSNGGLSQFLNASYRVLGGGYAKVPNTGANGGSGGASSFGPRSKGGSDGGDGDVGANPPYYGGSGQGHTTRDFGELAGKRNAGGGSSGIYNGSFIPQTVGGESDYLEGAGNNGTTTRCGGGGGYGGGAGAENSTGPVKGGDGTVLIRYYAYHE